jgi:hypothetical protein
MNIGTPTKTEIGIKSQNQFIEIIREKAERHTEPLSRKIVALVSLPLMGSAEQ